MTVPAHEVDVGNTLHIRLPNEIYNDLSDEALDARLTAHRIESDECQLEFDGAVNGRGRCWIAGPGARLREFHSGFGLKIARLFANEKSEVFPTRAAYLYYDEGDFSFFHHDAVHAHITVIVGLTDRLLPLLTYPDFTHINDIDVSRLNAIDVSGDVDFSEEIAQEFGNRALARSVEIPRQQAVAIRGRRVPHARPKQPNAGTICTACYSFLVPPQGWTII